MLTQEQADLLCTPIGYAEKVLGLPLYWWQDTVLTWFDDTSRGRVKGTLATPNGAGKSERVVASLTTWWLDVHPRGKVVITTKDSKQLDNQVYPAIKKHRAKHPAWKFVDRLIETPTGGRCVLFTTDEPGRAEGWHKEDDIEGPLLMIVDEAKSVPEEIFEALDRCTFNALLYVSSPGPKVGRFWDSHQPGSGFRQLKVGLSDCPHIPKDRIEDILKTYGPNDPFTRSTLYGEFMLSEERQRFNSDRLAEMADKAAKATPSMGMLDLQENDYKTSVTFRATPQEDAWVWIWEMPLDGCRYLVAVDPATGASQTVGADPDSHAVFVLRAGYYNQVGTWMPPKAVARIKHGAKWDIDILESEVWKLSLMYGNCMICPEMNLDRGLVELLKQRGTAIIYQRQSWNTVEKRMNNMLGWMTTAGNRSAIIEMLAKAIRENGTDGDGIEVLCPSAVKEMETFVIKENGRAEAMSRSHDDCVLSLCVGIACLSSATIYRAKDIRKRQLPPDYNRWKKWR